MKRNALSFALLTRTCLLSTLAGTQLDAATYLIDASQTSLASGVVVWNVTDGDYSGTLTLTSTNTPNILGASSTDFVFAYDPSIASEFEVVYESSAAASTSGQDSQIDTFSLFVGNTFGSEFYFENTATVFLSGDAVYGDSTGMAGTSLVAGNSGSGGSNAFSTVGGSEFGIVGEGADGSTFGWTMGFAFQPGIPTANFATFNGAVGLEAIPEPGSALLLSLFSLGAFLRRRRT